MGYSFLKDLDAPDKLSFSSKVVDYLLSIEQINDKNGLLAKRDLLKEYISDLISSEDRFRIARLEYEKKEQRFIEKTLWNQDKLDLKYRDMGLQFIDVPNKELRQAIDTEDFGYMLRYIEDAKNAIDTDIEICKKRTIFLINTWDTISNELMDKLRSFEFKGLKKASSNLRIRILPQISEYKSSLKKKLIRDAISRVEIHESIVQWIKDVRQDIFGELTKQQEYMLENINHDLTSQELIEYLKDDELREDLIYLLETEKIQIKLKKMIDDLI